MDIRTVAKNALLTLHATTAPEEVCCDRSTTDVDDHEAGCPTGHNTHIGVGPLLKPTLDNGQIRRCLVYPILYSRMFRWMLALCALSARALRAATIR